MSSSPDGPANSGVGIVAIASVLVSYLALALLAGAPDSPLVPPLPPGAGLPGWTVRGARAVGLNRLTRTQLVAMAIGLITVGLVAFAFVVREAWRRRLRVWLVLAATGVALGLAVASPLLLSRDVYSYAAYGRIVAVHGANPYARPPSAFPRDPFVVVASPEWIDTRSVYGPGFTLMSWGMARAWSGSPTGTILAFKLTAGVAVAVAAVMAAVGAAAIRPGRAAAAAAVVGLNPVMVVHTVGGAHNDALIAAFFAAAFALAALATGEHPSSGPGRDLTGRSVVVTLLLAAAVTVKSVAAPVLVLWLWQVSRGRGRWRAAGVHAVAAGALFLVVTVPVQAGWSTVRALLSVASRQGWASGPGLVARGGRGMGRALGGSGTGAAFDLLVSAAFAGLFLVLFLRLLARAGPEPHADRWGGAMLLLALCAPYLLPWYAAWFVPFLGLMEDRVLALAGLATAGLLALTGVPAEAGAAPTVWEDMVLAVHYVAAPVMLALLAVVANRVWRLGRAAVTTAPTTAPGALAPGAGQA